MSKNQELHRLNSEIKQFNTIVANDFHETIKWLYTSLEFIIKKDGKALTDPSRANLRRAQSAIQKMKLLAEDIMAYSSIQNSQDPQKKYVDLNEVTIYAIGILQEKIRHVDAQIIYDKLPVIEGYPSLLNVLFAHLIENAIKFSKPEVKPVIRITNDVMKGSDLQIINAKKDSLYQRISFEDNGEGFEPNQEEKIFEMFYQVSNRHNHKGSGIGLAICRKVMDLHEGYIKAHCIPDCTRFDCFFPVNR
jgi:light-regulated signal transduction histidine kinase (bacteriophytochrome)